MKINLRACRSCSAVHLGLQLRYLILLASTSAPCHRREDFSPAKQPPGISNNWPRTEWVEKQQRRRPWGNALIFQHSTQANPSHKRRRVFQSVGARWIFYGATSLFGREKLNCISDGNASRRNVLLRGVLRIRAIEKVPYRIFTRSSFLLDCGVGETQLRKQWIPLLARARFKKGGEKLIRTECAGKCALSTRRRMLFGW
jgi:hypothetical protein